MDPQKLRELSLDTSWPHEYGSTDHIEQGTSTLHEAPYLGRARFKPNSVASESYVHSTPLSKVSKRPSPKKTPETMELPSPQKAIIETQSPYHNQHKSSALVLKNIQRQLQEMITGECHLQEKPSTEAASVEDIDQITHTLNASVEQVQELVVSQQNDIKRLTSEKVQLLAQLEQQEGSLPALHCETESEASDPQAGIVVSDDEKVISELQMKLERLEEELMREKEARTSLQIHLNQLLKEKHQLEGELWKHQEAKVNQSTNTSLESVECVKESSTQTNQHLAVLEGAVASLTEERDILQADLTGKAQELSALKSLSTVQEQKLLELTQEVEQLKTLRPEKESPKTSPLPTETTGPHPNRGVGHSEELMSSQDAPMLASVTLRSIQGGSTDSKESDNFTTAYGHKANTLHGQTLFQTPNSDQFCSNSEHQWLEEEVVKLTDSLHEAQLRSQETLNMSKTLQVMIERQREGIAELQKEKDKLLRACEQLSTQSGANENAGGTQYSQPRQQESERCPDTHTFYMSEAIGVQQRELRAEAVKERKAEEKQMLQLRGECNQLQQKVRQMQLEMQDLKR